MAMVECSNCGKEIDEHWADYIDTGRKRYYFCRECYIKAHKEVASSEFMRMTRREKIAENKKVKK